MEMINIDPSRSSQIAQIGHDGQSLCRILFRRGGLYEYRNFDSETFAQFQSHPKPGEFFRERIKGNPAKFPFDKVQGSEFTSPAPTPTVIEATVQRTVIDEPGPVTPVPEIENQDVEQVAQKANLLVQNATTIKVIDPTTQHQASQVLLAIAAIRKEISDTFKPMKDAAFRAHRTICEQEKKHDKPLAEAEDAVKKQIGTFVAEQQRLAREAEEAARKAERERAEREAAEQAQERAIDDAVALEAIGDTVGAAAVLNHPAPMPVRYVAPAPIAPKVAQVAGVSTREDWDFRIVDESLIPREYLLVNESAIRALGKTTKGKAKVAGVEFYSRQIVAASRRG